MIGLLILGQLVGGTERVQRDGDLHWHTCETVAPDEDGLLPKARCRLHPGGASVLGWRFIRPPDDFRAQAMGSVPWVPPGPPPDSPEARPSTWTVASPQCQRCELAQWLSAAIDCGRARYPDWRREAEMLDCFETARQRGMTATMRFDGVGFDVVYSVASDQSIQLITIGNDGPCEALVTVQRCGEVPANPGLTAGCPSPGRVEVVCDERPSTRWSYSAPRPAAELFGIEPGYRRFFAENGVRIVCTAAWGRYHCVPDWVWARGLGGDAGVP